MNLHEEISRIKSLMVETKKNDLDHFIEYCKDFLKLKDIPDIEFKKGSDFSKKHKSFGYFDDKNDQIVISTHKRNEGDIMRTIAHELVHYKQKTLHQKGKSSAGSKHENDANAIAGEIMRKYGKKNPQIFE